MISKKASPRSWKKESRSLPVINPVQNDHIMKQLFTFLFLLVCSTAIAQPTDAYLLDRMDAARSPGGGFAVLKDDKLIMQRYLGLADVSSSKPVDAQTVFMMASVSKTMIATAAMQLWEKGMLNLDVNINNYIPFNVSSPYHPADSITMRMLLTHTSAIEDNWNVMGSLYVNGDSPLSLDSFMRGYFVPGGDYYSSSNNFYVYHPGATWNYSNMGSTLAAYVVERITGDLFHHYCDTAIFQKICMDNTAFLLAGIDDTTQVARPYGWTGSAYEDYGLYGYPDYPDGQLRTNIVALSRFMSMLMNHGQYEGTRVLDSATVDYMLKQQTPVRWSQGIIFYARTGNSGDTLWGHNGGDAGVNTAMYFSRSTKTGAIVFFNGDGSPSSYSDLLVDTLYRYGRTVQPAATDTFPSCNMTTPVHQVPAANNLHVYPNPAAGYFTLEVEEPGSLRLVDLSGRSVYSQIVTAGKNQVYVAGSITPGMYIVVLKNGTGEEYRTRIIIR
ncbi:MAG: T9SS type A sorting domain-containing protein [Sphingobacteriales bacterium]|nr:MAG: T9SS type A sorting domain-containing protein [Sphingobacteriales bacterium]